jgi:Transposase DDE domain
MGALVHVREWRACLRADLLADLHGHQVNALADLSFAMAAVGHCHSGRVAAAVAGRARAASSCRRLERTLANPRLKPSRVFAGLARFAADRLAGRPILLILDETHNGRRLACMKLSIAYRKRALPIAAACYRRDRPPHRMPRLIERLRRRAARGLPPGADVTLLTDRGLTWPAVLDACRALGWHFVGRVKGTTRLLRGDGSWHALSELVPRPGGRWSGRGRAFKEAGGRDLYVEAAWERGCREPWLLVSDRPDGYRGVRAYAKRFWTEELFRDEKGQGLQWRRGHVTDPAHGTRLMALMALATLLAVSLGTWVLKSGRRRWLESGRRRTLSVFRLGLRWLHAAIFQDRPMPRGVHLYPS